MSQGEKGRDPARDLRAIANCTVCGKKINYLTRRIYFCSDCFLNLPKELIVKLKQAKKKNQKAEINQLIDKCVQLLRAPEILQEHMGISDLKKHKRCVMCDKRVYAFGYCVDCWSVLPKKLRRSIKSSYKSSDLEELKRLLIECYNLIKISHGLKNIKNCLICNTKLGIFNSDLIPTGICTKCIGKQPEKWRNGLAQAQKDKRYDQIKSLVDMAVKGDFDIDFDDTIEDLLTPTHGSFKYKGGHPDFFEFTEVSLTDKPNGIVAFDNKSKEIFFTIKWDSITSISADKEVVTKSSVGLSAVGLLAGRPDLTVMGAAWKNNKENSFLNIGYRHSGMETIISFEGKKANEAAAYYISQASKYRGDTTENNGNGNKIKQDSSDPIDQIKKMAELKDAGVLTEEEFQSKKKDLLAAI